MTTNPNSVQSLRHRALLQDAERRALENIGTRAASVVASKVRGAILRAADRGLYQPDQIARSLHPLASILAAGMVAANLRGHLRSALNARRAPAVAKSGVHLALRIPGPDYGPYSSTIAYLTDRAGLDPADVARLADSYSYEAVRVLTKAQAWAEKPIAAAMEQITRTGLHVAGGMAKLREAFAAAGMAPAADNLLETLVRTQTQLAYSAGSTIYDSQPAIQQILWGYRAHCIHDDRTRPNHRALDGVTMDADDPRWEGLTAPLGYNCRCGRTSIMRDSLDAVGIPRGVTVVPPGPAAFADKGFGHNPLLVYRAFAA